MAGRQPEHEGCECVVAVLQEQISTVGADDFAGQAQTQPDAVHAVAAPFVGAIEPLEDALAVGGGNGDDSEGS